MVQDILLKRRKIISLSQELRNVLLQMKDDRAEQELLIEIYKKELLWLHNIIFNSYGTANAQCVM